MRITTITGGPLQVNSYILHLDDGRNLLIDPGDNVTAIKMLGLTFDAVLLTHAHYDHVGDLNYFIDENVPIYLDPADLVLLDSSKRGGCRHLAIKPFEPLDLPPQPLTLLRTPGHTLGSVCFKVDTLLFTGDTLFVGDVGRTDLFNSDTKAMKESLRMLLALGEHKIMPGHGQAGSLSGQRALIKSLVD